MSELDAAASWDELSATWDEGEAQRTYGAAAFDSLQRFASEAGVALDGARICDFGCGTGLLTQRLAPAAASIDAIDISKGMLQVLRDKAAAQGWQHVATHEGIAETPEAYDAVVCSSVCAFVDDYPGTVQKLAQALRPGGLFVQ